MTVSQSLTSKRLQEDYPDTSLWDKLQQHNPPPTQIHTYTEDFNGSNILHTYTLYCTGQERDARGKVPRTQCLQLRPHLPSNGLPGERSMRSTLSLP
ncbi:unnamed protein product [Coregonus sp. 'balchen']|nr:unnamed protein product [Coregonus sp. 'balchen']